MPGKTIHYKPGKMQEDILDLAKKQVASSYNAVIDQALLTLDEKYELRKKRGDKQ